MRRIHTAIGVAALLCWTGCRGETDEPGPGPLRSLVAEERPAAGVPTPHRPAGPALPHPGVDLTYSSFGQAGTALFLCVRPSDRHLLFLSEDGGRSWVNLAVPASDIRSVSCEGTDFGPLARTLEGAWRWQPAARKWELQDGEQPIPYHRFGKVLLSGNEKGLLVGDGRRWIVGAQFPPGSNIPWIKAIEHEGAPRALAAFWRKAASGLDSGHLVSDPHYVGGFMRLQVEGIDPVFVESLPGHGLIGTMSSGAVKKSGDLGKTWVDFGRPYPWAEATGGTQGPVKSLAVADARLLVATTAGSFSYDAQTQRWQKTQGLPGEGGPPRFVAVSGGRVFAVTARGLYVSQGAAPFEPCAFLDRPEKPGPPRRDRRPRG